LHVWDTSSKNKLLIQKLKEHGIEAKKGSWTDGEVKQMEENLNIYQKLNPDIDIFKVFYRGETGDNRAVLKKSNFWDILSYKICRSLTVIQGRFRHLYQDRAGYKIGRYSKKEVEYIRELVVKHGRNWSFISNLMNRSIGSLSVFYTTYIENDINKGHWNNDEKERFLIITNKIMKYNHENNIPLFKISWRTTSNFVLSRSSRSCQYFFSKNKVFLENSFYERYFTSTKKNAMIIYLYFSSVKSKAEIDWKELFVLYNGQFDEVSLKNQFTKLMSEVLNVDFQCAVENLYKKETIDLEVLFKRINFVNIMQYSMTKPLTVAYLKAKYYLLIHDLPNFMQKTSEEVIVILHTKYCSDKSKNTSTVTTH